MEQVQDKYARTPSGDKFKGFRVRDCKDFGCRVDSFMGFARFIGVQRFTGVRICLGLRSRIQVPS